MKCKPAFCAGALVPTRLCGFRALSSAVSLIQLTSATVISRVLTKMIPRESSLP